ncbi:cytochrome d ubiquinol oxidase subunit II [Ornithobacterium rhinotracheale]
METLLGIDYPTWWFLVVGALFSGYAILDGFDFGAGALHLFFKREDHRRIALNAIGPVWDGNEVWLVIGGGALFAGFPLFYATLFSAMYIPFMLFLVCLIFRAVSIEFRGKENMRWWKRTWDISYFVSSNLLAFLLGVVLGNILQGLPLNHELEYAGSAFFQFLNPFSILCGLSILALFVMHGAIYLLIKTRGQLFLQLENILKRAVILFIIIFTITTAYALTFIPHLYDDLMAEPYYFIFPILGFLSIANVPRLAHKKNFRGAFLFSSLTLSFMMMLVAVELYPELLRNTNNLANSITVYNAAASTKSLKIMMLIVAIGGPLVLGYTFFVYKTFWGKVELDEHSY